MNQPKFIPLIQYKKSLLIFYLLQKTSFEREIVNGAKINSKYQT